MEETNVYRDGKCSHYYDSYSMDIEMSISILSLILLINIFSIWSQYQKVNINDDVTLLSSRYWSNSTD